MLGSCTFQHRASWVITTEDGFWQEQPDLLSASPDTVEGIDVTIFPDIKKQEIEGFGACFNELDWISLSRLDPSVRESIMEELFFPDYGGNFSLGLLPMGANDFARDWYSYDETENDFELKDFTISNDKQTLIPFVKNALKYSSDIRFVSSPWSPPLWMKDSLSIDTLYMDAYARYFSKYVESFKKENIKIFAVMPQNELIGKTDDHGYIWNNEGLQQFICSYLGPQMEKEKVEVLFGSMAVLNTASADSIMSDSLCRLYIQGLAFQIAEEQSIKEIHNIYPRLKLYQTDKGNEGGQNSWKDAVYFWNKLFYSFSNGLSAYIYPNIALELQSINRLGQVRNSLVLVDSQTQSYNYTPEYFILRHFSHYIQSGARRIATTGTFTKILAFLNPDDTIAMIIGNESNDKRKVSIRIEDQIYQPELPSNSLSTIFIE